MPWPTAWWAMRPPAPALEITFLGPDLEVLDTADIAVTGAEMELTVNDVPVSQWASIRVHKGDRVSLRAGRQRQPRLSGCCRVVLMWKGHGQPLDVCERPYRRGVRTGLAVRRYPVRGPGRLLERPSAPPGNHCTAPIFICGRSPDPKTTASLRGLETFFSSVYTVTDKINRMGCRLQGPVIERDALASQSIISEPSIHGNVQVPPDGQPIILMVEQTIGGYTKIATVVTADLFKIAQARPGDRIHFHPVTLAGAHTLYREWKQYLLDACEVLDSDCAQAPV
jgi:allophanate hydrolase subunit 2